MCGGEGQSPETRTRWLRHLWQTTHEMPIQDNYLWVLELLWLCQSHNKSLYSQLVISVNLGIGASHSFSQARDSWVCPLLCCRFNAETVKPSIFFRQTLVNINYMWPLSLCQYSSYARRILIQSQASRLESLGKHIIDVIAHPCKCVSRS